MTLPPPAPAASDALIPFDLEEHARSGAAAPKHPRYRIRIDDDRYVVDSSALTGRQILALAGKTPEQYHLSMKIHGGGVRRIGADEPVDLTQPGVERFVTVRKESTDGSGDRRQFRLPEGDEEFLGHTGLRWETVIEGSQRWLLVHGRPVVPGFNVPSAATALEIAPLYPAVQIDMAYFNPALTRPDGRPIPALTAQTIDGRSWQRWSRHRTPQGAWRPGIDNVASHLAYTDEWLSAELRRAA